MRIIELFDLNSVPDPASPSAGAGVSLAAGLNSPIPPELKFGDPPDRLKALSAGKILIDGCQEQASEPAPSKEPCFITYVYEGRPPAKFFRSLPGAVLADYAFARGRLVQIDHSHHYRLPIVIGKNSAEIENLMNTAYLQELERNLGPGSKEIKASVSWEEPGRMLIFTPYKIKERDFVQTVRIRKPRTDPGSPYPFPPVGADFMRQAWNGPLESSFNYFIPAGLDFGDSPETVRKAAGRPELDLRRREPDQLQFLYLGNILNYEDEGTASIITIFDFSDEQLRRVQTLINFETAPADQVRKISEQRLGHLLETLTDLYGPASGASGEVLYWEFEDSALALIEVEQDPEDEADHYAVILSLEPLRADRDYGAYVD